MSEMKSYSQRKRDKFDYRREYFKSNPGIFGCVWICAYCGKPLLGKQNVVVDHIMPLNNVLGRNAKYNLVSSCQVCNSKKSDKVDHRVIQGYIAKGVQSVLFKIQSVVLLAAVAVWALICKVFNVIIHLLLAPFGKTSMTTKVIAIVVYMAVVYYFLSLFGWR